MPDMIRKLMRWEELCVVDPRSLGDNPRNWKTHPQTQLDSALAAINKVGWALPLLYNVTTGKLVDGHGRKAKAIKAGLTAVPVAKGRWTEEEENFLLHSLDTIGSMYRIDAPKFKSLTELVRGQEGFLASAGKSSRKALDKLLSGAKNFASAIERGDRSSAPVDLAPFSSRKKQGEVRDPEEDGADESTDTEETGDPVRGVVTEEVAIEDVLFDGDPDWGIPDLLPELLCTPDMIPRVTYDRSPESVTENSYYCITTQPWRERDELGVKGGVLGLFADDYHFDGFYDNPTDYVGMLRDYDFSCLCSPDYSNYEEWPFPMRLWSLYRSRWVSRYWQGHGFRILPVLHTCWAAVRDESGDRDEYDLGTHTLYRCGPSVVACQCRTIKHQGGSFEEFGKWLSRCVSDIPSIRTIVIYGGSEHQAKFEGYLPRKIGRSKLEYVMLPSFMSLRRGKIKRKGK